MNLLINILIFALSVQLAYGCNGYDMHVNNIKNCDKDNVITLKNTNFKLNNNCTVTVNGCMNIKGFSTAKLAYTVTKAPLPPMTRKIDMCNNAEQDEMIQSILTVMNMPQKCPFKAMNVCRNKKTINIPNLKNQLQFMIGTTKVKFDIDHGNSKSCLNFDVTVTKK